LAAPKREVSRSEYYRELSLLGVKGAKRKRLRSSYFSFLGQLSGIARERRTLIRRIPYASIISRVIIGDRIRELDHRRTRILTQMRRIRTIELPELEEQIRTELREFRTKIKPPPPPPAPILYRIHIRLYNHAREPTPSGSFQTFWEIDGIIDPDTSMVDFDWWLTKEEIEICRYHMVGFFKGFAKWRSPNQLGLAYFDDPKGIAHEGEPVMYKRTKEGRPYTKRIPESFIAKAEALTIGELIIGESSKEPEPVSEPEGCFFERAMIIDKDGAIKWDEIRNKLVYRPTEAEIERVKEELK